MLPPKRRVRTCETSFTVSKLGVATNELLWRLPIRFWRPSITCFSKNVSYNDLGDLYLDKINKHHLTRNLVHRLERLGFHVTLELKAA